MYRIVVLLCSIVFASGCVFNSHREEVIGGDAPRRHVSFESDKALRRFGQEVAGRYPAARRQGHDTFAIPFVIAASTTKVLSENAFYNSQVAKADVNGDETLSDSEVDAYVAVR